MGSLIEPHGGRLLNLLVDEDRAVVLKNESPTFCALTLTQRQLCDLEVLMNGGFSPLTGFMNQSAYETVVDNLRLPDGVFWPMPVILDVASALAEQLTIGERLALRDEEGFMLAALRIESIWSPDKQREAMKVYGTASATHPGVRYLFEQTHDIYVGGAIEGIQLPLHYDFTSLRHTPAGLRERFTTLGWRRILAFHTSKPMHRVHRDITLDAAKETQSNILLHPVVGMAKPGDLHYHARVHCYQSIRRYFPQDMVMLALAPLAMRMAGPREALLDALVRQNYGCTHFMVGPEHAAPPGVRDGGERFYAAGAAQDFARQFQKEIGIELVAVKERRYVSSRDRYLPVVQIEQEGLQSVSFTESQLYQHLAHNLPIPEWFSYPEVIAELQKVRPTRSKKGITLFFTGLSGSGKSTLAKILYGKFVEAGNRPVTLLDGDVVRLNLSSELGFSKIHRDLNVRRIGFVASEISKNGGVAICAPIAPYASTRRAVRDMIEQHGAFIEVHVATPLEVCENRDRKGLYAKARKGLIPEFTGVSDPYEVPEQPEVRIDTSQLTPMQAAQDILLYLAREGYFYFQDGQQK